MKSLFIIPVLLLTLACAEKIASIDPCSPDKGIKTAVTSGEIVHADGSGNKEKLDRTQRVEFNEEGQPTLIRDEYDGSEHRRLYEDGKLQLIITTRKKLPDFYMNEQEDSLMKYAEYETDTAVVLSHYEDGRIKEIKGSDGMITTFQYDGCDAERNTLISAGGDTVQQVHKSNKEGVLTATTWTTFQPVKSNMTRIFSGYKFDEHEHWIQRSYEVREGTITETRTLTYY